MNPTVAVLARHDANEQEDVTELPELDALPHVQRDCVRERRDRGGHRTSIAPIGGAAPFRNTYRKPGIEGRWELAQVLAA